MIEQPLDLRQFLESMRRRLAVVIAMAALGLGAGIGYTLRYPPLPTSTALVLLQSAAARYMGTQVVIASSQPVLAGALGHVNPSMTLQTLRSRVKATSLAPGIVSISASGQTAAQAKSAANALAESYIVFIGRENSPIGSVRAETLTSGTNPTKKSLRIRLLLLGMMGLLLGTVIGAIVALALDRNRRPLRQRSEIAKAARVPVLASFPVSHPSGPAGWVRLLQQYRPAAPDARSLRSVLRRLGFGAAPLGHPENGSYVVRVYSLASDPGALAVGPQLAVFAASCGMPTTLIFGLHGDANKMTASLRAACSAAWDVIKEPPPMLNIDVKNAGEDDWLPATALTVIASVVDSRTRLRTEITPASVALLAVSAGVVTGEQLARIAARIAASGQQLVGAVVADPDAADYTTGRVLRSAWSADRLGPNGQHPLTTEITL
jgi:capsular polysaccharide biosynthesis protein